MTKVDVNIRRNGQLRVSLGDMELAFNVEVEEKGKVSVLWFRLICRRKRYGIIKCIMVQGFTLSIPSIYI